MVQQISVEKTARKVAGWFGFAISSSSHTNFSLYGKPHAPQAKNRPISNKDFHDICDGIKDEKKERNRTHIKKEDKCLKNQQTSQSNYIPLQTK